MKNTKVVATGVQTGGELEERERYNTVTIMATPEEAAKIVYAQEVGSLRVVLRASGDLDDSWPASMTLARLLGHPEPAKKRSFKTTRQIDVILGGKVGGRR